MWIMSKDGFVSVVQHNTDPSKFRVRARRREHLYPFGWPDEIIDFGTDAADYQFHMDVDRAKVTELVTQQLEAIDYTSHAKEAMAGEDDAYYDALMRTWGVMHSLQKPTERPARRRRRVNVKTI